MNDPKFDISGKHILVTGGSSGIGRQIAIYLTSQGAVVGINGRNEERLKETLSRMKGEDNYSIACDLTTLDNTEIIFEKCLNKRGKLDGFVYSAGVVPTLPLASTSIEKMENVLRINFVDFVDMARNFSKKKYGGKGSIVAISSIASVLPEKGQLLYSSSKAAVNAAVKIMAQELVSKRIRVNAVLPGVVLPESGVDENIINLTKNQYMGAVASADVARMVSFLISDASEYSTGQNFYVDGLRV